MSPSLSVRRRSLAYPFIHEWVRSTTQRLPTWIGAGTPLREISLSNPRSANRLRVTVLS